MIRGAIMLIKSLALSALLIMPVSSYATAIDEDKITATGAASAIGLLAACSIILPDKRPSYMKAAKNMRKLAMNNGLSWEVIKPKSIFLAEVLSELSDKDLLGYCFDIDENMMIVAGDSYD